MWLVRIESIREGNQLTFWGTYNLDNPSKIYRKSANNFLSIQIICLHFCREHNSHSAMFYAKCQED